MARFRISPAWWPVMAAASPVLAPVLALQARKFYQGQGEAARRNDERLAAAAPLELPELEHVELTVLVDHRHEPGFLGDAGVSYLLRSERGTLLMDVGFGPDRPALSHNWQRLPIDANSIDAVLISHLHLDHMGGLSATRAKRVTLPPDIVLRPGTPCYLPAPSDAPGLQPVVVERPTLLPGGFASTGPLSRMLCFMGMTDEQAIVARLKGRGLFVLTGCGHQTVEALFALVRRLSPVPIHTFAGGLHFPLTESRGARAGIQLQQILGTGKVWWERITVADLDAAIAALNEAGPQRLLLSGHDSCDFALDRIERQVRARTEVLQAGASYIV